MFCYRRSQPLHRLLLLGGLWLLAHPARAQIVPDSTLPENSRVTVEGDRRILDGGTTVGGNLFHSFEQFGVPTGAEAYFNNAANIDRIITRVTGGDISRIDGILAANGNASLFLLNPNGIQFGENAQLRLGGSFFATTADRLLFADGTGFDAARPSDPLLTLSIPVGLQFGDRPGAIVNRSRAESPLPLPELDPRLPLPDRPGLTVAPGRLLGLFGGNLDLDGGNLTAFQGQLHLGSVGGAGSVAFLPQDGGGLRFDYSRAPQGGTIALSNGATVTASGLGGGAIDSYSDRLSLSGGASLRSDTFGDIDGRGIAIAAQTVESSDRAFLSSSSFGGGRAGDILVRARDITLTGTQPGQVLAEIIAETFDPTRLRDGFYSLSVGAGAGGNVTVTGDRLHVQNGAALLTSALGTGDGSDLSLQLTTSLTLSGGSFGLSGTAGAGNAGDIEVSAPELRLFNGSLFSTASSATGTGNSGDLNVVAEVIELNTTPSGFVLPGGLFTSTLGTGDAGDLSVDTQQLRAIDGMQLSAASSSAGQGGSVSVRARESIELGGTSTDSIWLSGIFTTSSLLDVQGRTGTAGAGSLQVETQRLTLRGGGRISAATGGQGAAGNLLVTATEFLDVSGEIATALGRQEPSALFAESRGAGQAGDLRIQAGELRLSDRAEIAVRGRGTGAAGNLDITAQAVTLSGAAEIGASTVDGAGGNISLNVDRLQLTGGSQISTNTLGSGAAGNLTVRATDAIGLSGRTASGTPTRLTAGSVANTQGTGGSITVESPRLDLQNGAELSVSSQGSGNAGDAQLSGRVLSANDSRIAATSLLGQGGNLRLDFSEAAVLENGSTLATRAGTAATGGGDGGNIRLQAGAIALLDGSRIDANAFEGSGGNIQIVTQGLFRDDDSPITASSQFGIDGTVEVQTPDADAGTGLVELPEDPSDPASQIVSGCAATQGNTFAVTGRGGVPDNPLDGLRGSTSWADARDWRSLATEPATEPTLEAEPVAERTPERTANAEPEPLQEATRWVRRGDGRVELVSPQRAQSQPPHCRAVRERIQGQTFPQHPSQSSDTNE